MLENEKMCLIFCGRRNIYLIQETHIPCSDQNLVRTLWEYECWLSGSRTGSGGVAILFQNSFEFKVQKAVADPSLRYIMMEVTLNDRRVFLVNVYAPGQGGNLNS